VVKEIERLTGQIDFKSLPHLLDEGEVDVVGSVASFGTEQEFKEKMSFLGTLGGHFEEFVDELILTPDATPAQPPHLALPNYVYRLIALNRS